jgi:carboxyl-terminal processing protease
LDYTNRDVKTGKVPKFSDNGVNEFKTENGRIVYDGGGVMPDIEIKISKRTDATKKLISSKAIFNFATNFYYNNPEIVDAKKYKFSNTDFKSFTAFLEKDTTFVTEQERLFKEAYLSSENTSISKEYEKITEKLVEHKISEIVKNKDVITILLAEEVLEKYYYKEGVYVHNLKNDETISEAVKLLKNEDAYKQILSGN